MASVSASMGSVACVASPRLTALPARGVRVIALAPRAGARLRATLKVCRAFPSVLPPRGVLAAVTARARPSSSNNPVCPTRDFRPLAIAAFCFRCRNERLRRVKKPRRPDVAAAAEASLISPRTPLVLFFPVPNRRPRPPQPRSPAVAPSSRARPWRLRTRPPRSPARRRRRRRAARATTTTTSSSRI